MSLKHWTTMKLSFNTLKHFKRFLSSSSSLAIDYPVTKVEQNQNLLQKTTEDFSFVTPYFPQSFNIAAYINKSEMLQKLLHLHVDFSKIEKKPYVVEKLLKLNFDDIKDHIIFLKDYVEADTLGTFITKNPLIFCENLEDLTVRINYLESKLFSHDQIKQIVTRNPFWLMLSTTRIDRRLGFFQDQFNLIGDEVRFLACKQPKLITYNLHHLKTNSFVIKEEMGYEDAERKQLLLKTPKLWMLNQKTLLERFNFIHNIMKIDHNVILFNSHVLLSRNFRVKQRHMFLEKLGRAQYDPTKENYVPIIALVEKTDIEFCKEYAKCNVVDFNLFLKTM